MIANPVARTILCFGDSNTNGLPSNGVEYVRLAVDVRWTGRLQRKLGDGYDVLEEGLSGRTTDVDDEERPGLNGRLYFLPCVLSHHPIDVLVLMLGTNDLKSQFDRTPADIAMALSGYLDDLESIATMVEGRMPRTILVSPIHVDDSQPAYVGATAGLLDATAVDRSRRLTDELRRLAHDRRVLFADAAAVARAGDDGIHLSPDSHEPLAELIAVTVKAALSGDPP